MIISKNNKFLFISRIYWIHHEVLIWMSTHTKNHKQSRMFFGTLINQFFIWYVNFVFIRFDCLNNCSMVLFMCKNTCLLCWMISNQFSSLYYPSCLLCNGLNCYSYISLLIVYCFIFQHFHEEGEHWVYDRPLVKRLRSGTTSWEPVLSSDL